MDDKFTMKSSRNKVSPEDGKSEVYTIYNSSLEEVRDMDRALLLTLNSQKKIAI